MFLAGMLAAEAPGAGKPGWAGNYCGSGTGRWGRWCKIPIL